MILKWRSPFEVSRYIDRLKRESQAIVDELISLSYFMRNNSYDSLMFKSKYERERMHEFLKGRFEIESKRQHPIY